MELEGSRSVRLSTCLDIAQSTSTVTTVAVTTSTVYSMITATVSSRWPTQTITSTSTTTRIAVTIISTVTTTITTTRTVEQTTTIIPTSTSTITTTSFWAGQPPGPQVTERKLVRRQAGIPAQCSCFLTSTFAFTIPFLPTFTTSTISSTTTRTSTIRTTTTLYPKFTTTRTITVLSTSTRFSTVIRTATASGVITNTVAITGSANVVTHTTTVFSPSPSPNATCGNSGINVAMYNDPYPIHGNQPSPDFEPADFASLAPYNRTTADIVGFSSSSGYHPHGLVPLQSDNRYVLDYHGYIYIPKTTTYTFELSAVNDIACMWIGNNAISGYTKANANTCAEYNYAGQGTGYNSFQADLSGGSYLPLRIIFENNSGSATLVLVVRDGDGTYYVDIESMDSSPYLILFSCDGFAPKFNTISPVPDTSCSNAGLEVAIYNNSYPGTTDHRPDYDFQFFKTDTPIDQKVTSELGFTVYETANPLGFTPYNELFALNFRGWFYAPKSSNYTFNLFNVDDYACLWTGSKAVVGFTAANNDTCAQYGAAQGHYVTYITAGSYLAFRLMYGNGGSVGAFNLTITDIYNTVYVQNGVPSPFWVKESCDGTRAAYPYPDPFGSEH
ncbi:hypothetical protein ABW20_dc0105075 [Dactylellina cionopaga]|nr:hypothetical protein ABW20_dc0105075 [Dactylellina cionopaga]